MKLSKLLLAVAGASVLLGVLVASASTRNVEYSSRRLKEQFTRLDFFGGFGTVECEIVIKSLLHTRTITKALGSLIGYITEMRAVRCTRGGMTVNSETFPWHRRYWGFVGTLPNVSVLEHFVPGLEMTIREPTFGVTCTVRREASLAIISHSVSAGTVTRASISGNNRCGEFNGELRGTTTAVDDEAGARYTIRLI